MGDFSGMFNMPVRNNLVEMLNQPTGQAPQQDPQADRNRLIQLLTQANQPEQQGLLDIAPEQSMSGQMADRALAALSDGLRAASGMGGGYSAIQDLQRQREDRQARIDYNARATATNKSNAGRAAAGAEADVLGREISSRQSVADRKAEQEAVARRQAEDDARQLGVEYNANTTSDELAKSIAKARRDLQDAGKTSIYEKRADDISNDAANNRVKLPPALVQRMRTGDESAVSEARNLIASRPDAASDKKDDKSEKDQEDRLDEATDAVDGLITGAPETEKSAAVPSLKELATQGVSLDRIWKDFNRNNDRLRLDDKRRASAEKFFWTYAYPEYMDAYAKRFPEGGAGLPKPPETAAKKK